MRPRAGELVKMRSVQTDHMPDEAIVLTYGSSEGGYGQDVATWTPGEALACGYKPTNESEINEDQEAEVLMAEMRLPHGTTISRLDKVQLTALKGETLAAPLTFEVIGTPKPGPTGIVVTLRLING